jgi:DNA polymerase III sliding clamp (beta) subunit (PCNA family)
MKMSKITVNANPVQIRAAIHTAAEKDIRYYLRGVLIEGESTYTRVVSTDGHIASVQGYEVENAGTAVFILPLATAKMVGAKDKFCEFTSEDEGKTWAMKTNSVSVNFPPVDGKFPDWRRIVPKPRYDIEQKPSQFNPELLIRFSKAAKILDQKTVIVTHNDNGAGLVSIGLTNYAGVIMPLSSKFVDTAIIKTFDDKLISTLEN